MATKQIVERNFSRHAGRYDAHTAVQQAIGAKLVERLGGHAFSRILDIGCGTGNYTSLLHQRYPAAWIEGIDLSTEMIEIAQTKLGEQGVKFVVGDAETVSFDTPFDLISSNACFHWFADLGGTLGRCAEALTENGRLVFSSLGPRTFWELSAGLDAVLETPMAISAQSFKDRAELETILRRCFPHAAVAEETIVEEYGSSLELLNTIKYAGTRGHGLEGLALTKAQLKALEAEYRQCFGSIAATYQVFYCEARRKEAERV